MKVVNRYHDLLGHDQDGQKVNSEFSHHYCEAKGHNAMNKKLGTRKANLRVEL